MKFFNSLLFLLVFSSYLIAQENIFLNRDYWKAQPSLEKVKDDQRQGNSATALNSYMFDAPVYAILENTNLEIIQYLVSLEGNGVDKITHDGRNYLLWAGYAGDKDVIKWLIDQGSNVHHIDEHGYGLVTFSAIGGIIDPEIYNLYVSKGLSLKEKNRDGANALLLASSHVNGLEDLSYFINNGLSINDTDDQDNNIFLYAVSKGNISLLQDLVDAKIDYKKVNNQGQNAVILAAQGARRHTNNIEVFSFLKNLQLDFTQKDSNEETALHYAAYRNKNADVLQFLIEQGIDPMALDVDGNPAVFNAVAYNNAVAFEILLPYVKDFDLENNLGETLMSKAIASRNDFVTQLLLDKKIDLKHKDKYNNSYINLLFSNYRTRSKAYFNKYLNIFLQHGVVPTIETDKGNSIVHTAVNLQDLYLLEKAIALSNDLNIKNKKGLTPLQQAALKARDVALLQKLVNAGADKTVMTEFNESVYDLAKENEALQDDNIKFLK